MNEFSSIEPSAHHFALFLIQLGISEEVFEFIDFEPTLIIFSFIKNSIPFVKEESSIEPSAHHLALFLIQSGTPDVFGVSKSVESMFNENSEYLYRGKSD